MKTVSLKLPEELDSRLTEMARSKDVSKSSLVREAIAKYVAAPSQGVVAGSFLARARDLAGCVCGPEDLSTNATHLRDLGE